ncbi:MAG: LemA family protein [Alphaproteobacteria bacterium]|nr:LemA family protein [Alphaproteobacteria bacterium]
MPIILGVSIVVLCILGYVIFLYNRFVWLDNQCNEGWSGIDVQLKRRYDLIPTLVATVRGYAHYEEETLQKIIMMRNQARSHDIYQDKAVFENEMISGVKQLFALVEAYPDLKADKNFLQLQDTLIDIEDDLQRTRRYYNATVRNLNTVVETFPSCIVAKMFRFRQRTFFEIDEIERQNVKVDLQ